MRQRLKRNFVVCLMVLLPIGPTLQLSPLGLVPKAHAQIERRSSDRGIALPELGDSTSGLISSAQEHELGRAWLRVFRSQVDVIDDPLLQVYVEDLVYRLAVNSQLEDRRLEIVLVDNPTMNAFAVPGGIIGVHNGMFLYADTEAQLASVLSHELAHLSQRHFARSVEQQRRNSIPTMAGLLASIVLAATAGGDAGMAAMTATQAAALQSRLNYSRQNEQEADRIGMETLVESGYDPAAAPAMFDNMQAAYRYSGSRPPEFLLTHPLTENRISDTRNRARQYPRTVYVDPIDYQLMRARARVQLAENSAQAIKQLNARLKQSTGTGSEADRYGLTLALTDAARYNAAREQLAPLLAMRPNQIAYILADARIDSGLEDYDTAARKLRSALRVNPGNHPLTMAYADVLMRQQQPEQAERLLSEHVERRPNDPAIWYQLAEVRGLAGDIVGVHRARAEYFVLVGALSLAERQLGYALPLVKGRDLTALRIEERIRQIRQLAREMEQL